MERAEAAQDGSWSSFSAAALVEESEFMAQLLGPCQFSNEQGQHDQSYGLNSMQWSSDHAADSYYCSSDIVNGRSSVYYWSQGDENSNNSLQFAATPGYESYYNLNESSKIPADNACTAAMNYCMVGDQLARQSLRVITNPPVGDPTGMNEEANSDDHGDSSRNVTEAVQPKRKPQMLDDNFPSQSCKKKTRASTNVTKSSSKKAQSKRILKGSGNGEDRENTACAANGGQSSCSYSSEDDSQASQEQNGGGCTSSSSMGTAALNPNGKSRAGRGSATDPQSLYARKRRERINERLKILQNLVPNGTKVDISTMLEEAVQYVKFLQLQIKLLSSDDLWMYAPIAYNGMNIGLDLKISPTQ